MVGDMIERAPFVVPPDAPVVVHRHGEGSRRRSIVVVLDEVDAADADERLAQWRLRIGGWVSQAHAADILGVSVKRIGQLRRAGRLKSRTIGRVVAIDAASLDEESARRTETAEQ